MMEMIKREVHFMNTIQCPFVMKLVDFFHFSNAIDQCNYAVFVMDEAKYDLDRRMQLNLSEEQMKAFTAHALAGLANIHAQNLLHRDIKPGNFFIFEENG